MKKFIIKDIYENSYYCESVFGLFSYNWDDDIAVALTFDTKEEAEKIIKDFGNGYYKIEEIYIVG